MATNRPSKRPASQMVANTNHYLSNQENEQKLLCEMKQLEEKIREKSVELQVVREKFAKINTPKPSTVRSGNTVGCPLFLGHDSLTCVLEFLDARSIAFCEMSCTTLKHAAHQVWLNRKEASDETIFDAKKKHIRYYLASSHAREMETRVFFEQYRYCLYNFPAYLSSGGYFDHMDEYDVLIRVSDARMKNVEDWPVIGTDKYLLFEKFNTNSSNRKKNGMPDPRSPFLEEEIPISVGFCFSAHELYNIFKKKNFVKRHDEFEWIILDEDYICETVTSSLLLLTATAVHKVTNHVHMLALTWGIDEFETFEHKKRISCNGDWMQTISHVDEICRITMKIVYDDFKEDVDEVEDRVHVHFDLDYRCPRSEFLLDYAPSPFHSRPDMKFVRLPDASWESRNRKL